MEGPKKKVANVLISLPYNYKYMLLQEEIHQCNKRYLPWEHPRRGQSYICNTCFRSLKGLHIGQLVIRP